LPVAALKNCSGNSDSDAVMLNVNMTNAAMLIVAALCVVNKSKFDW
jgi:hypothetical protein